MTEQKNRYWVVINFISDRTERIYWEGDSYVDLRFELSNSSGDDSEWDDDFCWVSDTLVKRSHIESISFENASIEDMAAAEQYPLNDYSVAAN